MFNVKKKVSFLLFSMILLAFFPICVSADTIEYKTVIEPNYDYARGFSDGLAAVKKDGKFGYINENNEEIIPFQYDAAWSFSEGKAVVGTLVDSGEVSAFDSRYNEAKLKLGVINRAGDYKPLIKHVYSPDYYEILASVEYEIPLKKAGFFHVVYDKSSNSFKYMRQGFKDSVDIEVVSESKKVDMIDTNRVGTYYNGFVLVEENPNDVLTYPHYFDASGMEYSIVSELEGSLYDIYKDYVISTYSPEMAAKIRRGEMNVPIPEMLGIDNSGYYPTDNLFPIVSERAYFRDVNSKAVLNNAFYLDAKPFNQGLALVSKRYNNEHKRYEWSFIDKAGRSPINGVFSDVAVYDYDVEPVVFNDGGLASLSNMSGLWGAIDKTGRVVIPFQYRSLGAFKEGLAPFASGGKYGYIDTRNNVVIPPIYNEATVFRNGLALVSNDFSTFIINKKGEHLEVPINLKFDELLLDNNLNGLSRLMVIEELGKYGFVQMSHASTAPELGEMSSWAYDEVKKAVEKDLVPVPLQNMYKTNTTRKDFAYLVVRTIEKVKGKSIVEVYREATGKNLYDDVAKERFIDTTDEQVIAAKKLGIINGIGENYFAPYNSITREQAAALLKRTANYLGKTSVNNALTYRDSAKIANYAKDSVSFVSALNIMNGVGNNTFDPKRTYTRQQAFMTIYRLYNAIN